MLIHNINVDLLSAKNINPHLNVMFSRTLSISLLCVTLMMMIIFTLKIQKTDIFFLHPYSNISSEKLNKPQAVNLNNKWTQESNAAFERELSHHPT